MKNLVKGAFILFCAIFLLSCEKGRQGGSSSDSSAQDGVVLTTCDDLKEINRILFITFVYDKLYDKNIDGQVTIDDKLIIERDLLEQGASCVTSLRGCNDIDIVEAQVDSWSDVQSWLYATNLSTVMKAAIVYSIIYNESGERCADDFDTGSFMGDVNVNGYLDCSDSVNIQKYTIGLPVDVFESSLADMNGSGSINATDALIDNIALLTLFKNYMNNLGDCIR